MNAAMPRSLVAVLAASLLAATACSPAREEASKGSAPVAAALRTVARGGTYLSPEVSDKFLECVRKGDFSRRNSAVLAPLTPRELQVMRHIAEGRSSKEIAAMLDLSLETVRGYRKNLMRKLQVNNVAALTQIAIAEGLTRKTQLGAGA